MQGFLPQIGSGFYSKVTSLHDFLKDFNCIYSILIYSWCFSPRGSFRYSSGVAAGPRAPLGMLGKGDKPNSCKDISEGVIAVLDVSSLFLIQETDKTLTFSREVKQGHYFFRNMFLY